MPGLNSIARQVADSIWQNNGPVSLSRATEIWLADNDYDLNSDTILEKFDRITELVSKHIQSKIQEYEKRRVKPKYQFSSVSPNVIVPQIDTNEAALRSELLAAINNLSWRAFEHLCVHMMYVAGTSKCKATSATRDQGIDFIGILELNTLVPSSVWHEVQIRVLGQAKHYRSTVGEEKIRPFHGDMKEFSRGEGRAFGSAPDWAKNIYMAQIGFVFALTDFSQGAKDYAASHSIMLKDSEQIVQDLLSSDVETPGLVRHGQHVMLNEHDFLAHFEQHT